MKLRSKLGLARAVLAHRITGVRAPIAVAWLVTGRCNADCAYCRWRPLRAAAELDTPSALDMIGQMQRAGVRLLSFTGGEPLLRPDIGRLIAEAVSRGLACKLNTNGALVERRLDELRGLDMLQISLDGPPSVQDRLRGEGSAERAERAIEAARRAGIPVQAVTCLTRDNAERIAEVLDHAVRLGVAVHVQPVSAVTLAPGEAATSVPSRALAAAALRHLLRLKQERSPRARAIGSTRSELAYYLRVVQGEVAGCECELVTGTLLPDGQLVFCGNARTLTPVDALRLGFAEAFARLTIPECDGCTCVGKLRLTRVIRLDPEVLLEMVRW